MKYFTKEELEDITNSILENPSYEMLNELNKKYNGEISVENKYEENSTPSVEETPVVENNMEFNPIQDVNMNLPTEEVPNENVTEVEVPNENPSIPDFPSFEVQSDSQVVEPSNENVSMPDFSQSNPIGPEPVMNAVPNTADLSSPSFEVQQDSPVEVPNETVPVPDFPQINPAGTEPVMNNMPNTADLLSPSFEVPNQDNNIGIQIIHDPNSQMVNMPNNMNNMMNNGPVLNSGMQPFYGSMEPQANKAPDIVFSNNSNMNPVAQNQMSGMPQDGMFGRESWAPHIENNGINNMNNMNMPGSNQMPNAGPQYQQGPSMFSQLQNPNQQ